MANKMQRLLPSLREKKRYLVFRILSKSKITDINAALRQIWIDIASYFGQKDMADANVQIMKNKYDSEQQKGIIRVGHKYVNQLKTALMLINKLNDTEVIVKSVKVSGILRKTNLNI